jgi:hypothetical protein
MRELREKVRVAGDIFVEAMKLEARETREAYEILKKYAREGRVSEEEGEKFREQFLDILKILGIGIPFALVPGASILLPLALKLSRRHGVDLLPSSFRKKEKE